MSKFNASLMVRERAARYGIAEWFGRDVAKMTPGERLEFARIALAQHTGAPVTRTPTCPFRSTLIEGASCNKKGGVCTLRKLVAGPDGSGVSVSGDKIATVCPSRFIGAVSEGKSLFVWIAEKMLDISNPTVVKETPFLRKIEEVATIADAKEDVVAEVLEEKKRAGRIDWILVNPATLEAGDLGWCAVETQALYFSGDKMPVEFAAYEAMPGNVLFPVGKRRPDYRSSGPKRLWPQLDVKVPVLRAWGKKVAVVIDSYFFANMNRLVDPSSRRADDRERRDNAEVVWFIVDFDDDFRLRAIAIAYASLEASRHALNATEPLGRADFTENLKHMVVRAPKNKVFRAPGQAPPL